MVVLTLNAGSSSLKFAAYRFDPDAALLLTGERDRIGSPGGRTVARDGSDHVLIDYPTDGNEFGPALADVFGRIPSVLRETPAAVGHRVAHGGMDFTVPLVVTELVLDSLRRLLPLAPNHLPAELAGIEAARMAFPDVPQVVCFDTAFHATKPAVAARYAVPREWHDAGVRRYGFHGLSCQYVVEELAHLGSGASLTAVKDGRPVDTTMGFTPMSGIVMGTRCGDLDPDVPLYVQRESRLSPDDVYEVLNKRSGLLGVSGTSADVRDLLAAEPTNPRAAEALDLFCYTARKAVGSLAATLGGLDTLVFTAGIGANNPTIRERICAGLEFLGVRIDADRNRSNAGMISPDGAGVVVRAMATNEEIVIARQAAALVRLAP